jgi:hypothetical protein
MSSTILSDILSIVMPPSLLTPEPHAPGVEKTVQAKRRARNGRTGAECAGTICDCAVWMIILARRE